MHSLRISEATKDKTSWGEGPIWLASAVSYLGKTYDGRYDGCWNHRGPSSQSCNRVFQKRAENERLTDGYPDESHAILKTSQGSIHSALSVAERLGAY